MNTLSLFLPGQYAVPSVGEWTVSRDCDPVALALYLRHYSARKNGPSLSLSFVGPGAHMVLLSRDGKALFVWRKELFRLDKLQGINCTIFRNEGNTLSSMLIADAMTAAWQKWPGERLFTFVNSGAVASRNPGYCFQKAGWKKCGRTKKGLLIFEVTP